jgi:hypothetical protein
MRRFFSGLLKQADYTFRNLIRQIGVSLAFKKNPARAWVLPHKANPL